MILGVLQFEITVPHSLSLKDKRRVVKSLKDRLHREHLVSIAETGALDRLQTAVLSMAVVTNSAPYASEVIDRVLEKVRSLPEVRLGSVSRKVIHESELEWRGDESPADAAEWAQAEQRMADEAERVLREVNP